MIQILRFIALLVVLMCTMVIWLPLGIGLYLYDKYYNTHYFNYMQ